MLTGIAHLHHFLPFLFLFLLITSLLRAAAGMITNFKTDKMLLFTLILAHIQLLLGLIMYLPSAFKNGFMVFGDHPLSMIVGVAVLTYGKIKSKKIEDNKKASNVIVITFLISLVLILSRSLDKLF